MQKFIDELLAVHPDVDPAGTEPTPWAGGPLEAQVTGGFGLIAVNEDDVEQIRPLIRSLAASLELVAFDPQLNELIPSATSVSRVSEFELPGPDELPLHLTAIIGEALNAGVTMVGILEQVESKYYVQWMARQGSLTIEAQGEALATEGERLSGEGGDQMLSLGFTDGDPNWSLFWGDGVANLDQAGQILSHVLTAVRRLPIGTPMALQTFPI